MEFGTVAGRRIVVKITEHHRLGAIHKMMPPSEMTYTDCRIGDFEVTLEHMNTVMEFF